MCNVPQVTLPSVVRTGKNPFSRISLTSTRTPAVNCGAKPFLVNSALLTPSKTRWRLPILALAGLALFHARAFATCEGLAALQLPNTSITKAEVVTSGKFSPPSENY